MILYRTPPQKKKNPNHIGLVIIRISFMCREFKNQWNQSESFSQTIKKKQQKTSEIVSAHACNCSYLD